MKWEKPSFIEISMSSEIGGYQEDDFKERNPDPTHRVRQPDLQADTVRSEIDRGPVSAR